MWWGGGVQSSQRTLFHQGVPIMSRAFVTKSAAVLIATVTALCTPSLASAQGIGTYLDAKTSTSGTSMTAGNYMYPSGAIALEAFGGAEIELVSLTAELQWLNPNGGAWTSFSPALAQDAAAGKATW